jgi:formyltetrahydrofolate-dependent phosphoribosylglycinamide formyltransferase
MFERLQKKWKVNGLQLALVLCTFAIGGSLTGYTARKLMGLFVIEQSWLWIVIYILLITLLWPLAVLLVSIPFGQFRFFINYLKKIGRRMGVVSREPVGSRQLVVGGQESEKGDAFQQPPVIKQGTSKLRNIAIFASGAGSNAQKIIDYFRDSSSVRVSLIVCNKPGAGVLRIAGKENIPALLIEKEKFFHGNAYIDELEKYAIDFIVLAGFLWKIPASLIRTWPGRIINIHPALLPGYGGKGMYGSRVHEAVIAAGDRESGISIHYVDELYDHGEIILQEKCTVLPEDTPATLAQKIHALEHKHYPALIGQLIAEKLPG